MYIHNKIYLLIGDWFSVLKIKETTTFYISVFYKEKKPTNLCSSKFSVLLNLYLINIIQPYGSKEG